PAFPRPPACTCALTTTVTPNIRAICSACSAVVAISPGGTGIPARRNISFAWYSWIFIGEIYRIENGSETRNTKLTGNGCSCVAAHCSHALLQSGDHRAAASCRHELHCGANLGSHASLTEGFLFIEF